MKNPNGYGSVYKLKGNRRNPYVARITCGYDVDYETGKLKTDRKILGYYGTQAEARQALADWHKNPNSLELNITFEEIFRQWSAEKFTNISASNVNGYNAAFKALAPLHKERFRDLQPLAIQKVINGSGKNWPTRKKMLTLVSQMYKFAALNRIIPGDVNPARSIDIGKKEQTGKLHTRFSTEEVERLWQWKGNDYVQVILILIYTGARPGELFATRKEDVHLDQRYWFIPAGKTEAATRRVPLHDAILPFVENWFQRPGDFLITQQNGRAINFQTNHRQYSETYWEPVLDEIGILTYTAEDGSERTHKPHDCRHTFTSMWKTEKLDEAMRRKIQGHAGKGIGERVYTEYNMETLLSEVNKLWTPRE